MLLEKTVFVLGAGASAEVGMPVSAQLKLAISELLEDRMSSDGRTSRSAESHEFRSAVADSLPIFRGQKGLLYSAAFRISTGVSFASSIDNFLKITGDERVTALAKASIAKVILDCERNSKLWFDPKSYSNHLDPTKIDNTWYQEFAQLFFEGLTWDDIPKELEKLVVVSFNYDRCFEHFMRHAMRALYGTSLHEVDEVLRNLKVIHPYGLVGELDWQLTNPQHPGIEFGGNWQNRLAELSPQIRTFNEAADDGILRQVRDEVASVGKLVFLGFAFHPQNVSMFKTKGPSKEKDIYATTRMISNVAWDAIKRELLANLGGINPPNNDPAGLRFFPESLRCASYLNRNASALTR